MLYIYINQDPSFPHIVIVERGHLLLLQQCDLCWRHSKVPIFFEECDCPGVRVPRCHDCKRYLHRLSLAHLGIPLDRQDGFNVHLYVPLSGGNLCGQRNFNGREPSLLYLGGIFVLVWQGRTWPVTVHAMQCEPSESHAQVTAIQSQHAVVGSRRMRAVWTIGIACTSHSNSESARGRWK